MHCPSEPETRARRIDALQRIGASPRHAVRLHKRETLTFVGNQLRGNHDYKT
jgi:hypothetical protein